MLLLLLLSRFSRVRLCTTPYTAALPGSPVPGILQARTLEWVAISFSNAWKWKGKAKSLSRVWPSATPWTAAHQAPPSMGLSRQEDWSGLPLPFRIYIFLDFFSSVFTGFLFIWYAYYVFSGAVYIRLFYIYMCGICMMLYMYKIYHKYAPFI